MHDHEFLTVEQFADRLQVSRTTVFGWLKSGHLVQGTHFFKIGRVLRFVWDAALFMHDKGTEPSPETPTASRPKGERQQRIPSQPAVNLDY